MRVSSLPSSNRRSPTANPSPPMVVIDLDEIETPAIDTAAEIATSDLRIMNSLAYFNKVYDDTMSLISSGKIRDTGLRSLRRSI